MSGNFIDSSVISNYNKVLSGNVQKFNNNLQGNPIQEFDDILNSQMKDFETNQLNGSVSFDNIMSGKNVEQGGLAEGSEAQSMMNNLKNAFGNGLNSVNDKQLASQNAIETFATGGDIDVHEVMIASQKASLSMQMALQMRNKMITFYNEIKNLSF